MATNKAFCSYQEIIDLHTESDRVTAIGIHTPNNDTPQKMFGGFFDQFKKYKYLGCSITLVPVARLPVDPLQVSYDAGEPTIDPRDVVNPIMFHGCHGNDLGAILNMLYTVGTLGSSDFADVFKTDSADIAEFFNGDTLIPDERMTLLENLYYKALVDNTWKKAHPQKGFKKSGLRPLIYKLAANHQITDYSPADNLNQGAYGVPELVTGTDNVLQMPVEPDVRFFTNKLTSLGWLDTRMVIGSGVDNVIVDDSTLEGLQESLSTLLNETTKLTTLPKIFMGVILLPPAYKTEQYFRMIINHSFEFAGFRGLSFKNDTLNQMPPSYFNVNDSDPEPPSARHSATITFSTIRQVQPYDFADLTVTIGGVTKSCPANGTSLIWSGLEDGVDYAIRFNTPEGYSYVSQDPIYVRTSGSDVTTTCTVYFQALSNDTPSVITLSNVQSGTPSTYLDYQIDSDASATLSTVSVTVEGTLNNIVYTSTEMALDSSTGHIYLKYALNQYSTAYIDLATGKSYLYSFQSSSFAENNTQTIISVTGTDTDLIELLQSGDYTVEVE